MDGSRPPQANCLIILSTLNFLRAQHISTEGLLDGLSYPREYLLRAGNWIDYPTYLEWHRRVSALLEHRPERYFALGRGIVVQGWMSLFAPLAGYLASPLHFFSVLPLLMPRIIMNFISLEVRQVESKKVCISFRFAPGTHPDPLVVELFRGNLSAIPSWFGQHDARVDTVWNGGPQVDYEVTLAGRQRSVPLALWSEARRRLSMLPFWHRGSIAFGPTSKELIEANVRVAQKVEELTFARNELAQLNEKLLHEMEERDRADRARREIEVRMLEAQKLETIGVLAGGIAHDFNNLLLGILTNLELAERSLPEGSPAATYHQRIGIAARRAAELCRLMLAYAGKGQMVLEHAALEEISREMADLVASSSAFRKEISVQVDDALPLVHGDVALLRQIVLNLLTNAVEALGGREGGVSLELAPVLCTAEALVSPYGASDLPAGSYVRLRVRDSGGGMTPDTLMRAFDPFFTTKFTGRGMGLAAVQGAVRSLQGALWVESQPGVGTCFEILLPAAAEESLRKPTPQALPVSWDGRGTVLLVDDEREVRDVGREILETAGYRVITAKNGQEAIEAYKTHRDGVDCVLLDLTMPKMDGVEACRELQRLAPDLRILLTSGYSAQDLDCRLDRVGECPFLPKPYSASTLIEAVQNLLPSEG